MIDKFIAEKTCEILPPAIRAANTATTCSVMTKLACHRRVASGVAAAALILAPNLARAANLLDGLNGTWSGRGQVTFEGGSSENLSCRAYYVTSATVLSLAIRCASTSYKTEIRSKLQIANGALAGEWEERNFNAVGSAAGAVSGNAIVLHISGAIAGRLTIEQSGSRQSVTISTNGGRLSSVKIGLSKS